MSRRRSRRCTTHAQRAPTSFSLVAWSSAPAWWGAHGRIPRSLAGTRCRPSCAALRWPRIRPLTARQSSAGGCPRLWCESSRVAGWQPPMPGCRQPWWPWPRAMHHALARPMPGSARRGRPRRGSRSRPEQSARTLWTLLRPDPERAQSAVGCRLRSVRRGTQQGAKRSREARASWTMETVNAAHPLSPGPRGCGHQPEPSSDARNGLGAPRVAPDRRTARAAPAVDPSSGERAPACAGALAIGGQSLATTKAQCRRRFDCCWHAALPPADWKRAPSE